MTKTKKIKTNGNNNKTLTNAYSLFRWKHRNPIPFCPHAHTTVFHDTTPQKSVTQPTVGEVILMHRQHLKLSNSQWDLLLVLQIQQMYKRFSTILASYRIVSLLIVLFLFSLNIYSISDTSHPGEIGLGPPGHCYPWIFKSLKSAVSICWRWVCSGCRQEDDCDQDNTLSFPYRIFLFTELYKCYFFCVSPRLLTHFFFVLNNNGFFGPFINYLFCP